MTAKLHCFGESGNAWRVALMLELTQTPWQAVYVDFFNGAGRSPEFLALNPMGEVPVLEIEGRVMTQSGVMLMHLAEKTGQFAPSTPAEKDEVLRWLFWDNHKFSGQIGTLRYLMNFLPAGKEMPEVVAFLCGRMKQAYRVLDQHLATRDWVVGGKPTIADFSLCAYLYYPEPFGFDRADWPHIAAWLDRIAALPGWKHPYELMPGNPSDRVQGGAAEKAAASS